MSEVSPYWSVPTFPPDTASTVAIDPRGTPETGDSSGAMGTRNLVGILQNGKGGVKIMRFKNNVGGFWGFGAKEEQF